MEQRRQRILTELIDLIGPTATCDLIGTRGGTRVSVPLQPRDDSPLTQVIGLAAANRLAAVWGGDRLEVPRPPARELKIVTLRSAGETIDQIALAAQCTRRRVQQVLAKYRADETAARG